MKISLCMIVKNEEEVLARCLESVKGLFDEIVIADTGSTDKTKDIARLFTDRIFDYIWQDNFAAARNFAFSKATGDYVAWLDADDVVTKENAEKFSAVRKLMETERPDMIFCPYDTAFDETGNPVHTFYRERFVRRDGGFLWQGRVHECIAPHGKTAKSDFRIFHLGSKKERGMRNLNIYLKWASEEKLDGRNMFYFGRELFYHRKFLEAVTVLEDMLSGDGWYVNKIEACKILGGCHAALKNHDKEKEAFLKSFLYGEPRASLCVELAAAFKRENRLNEAIYWFEAARKCRDHSEEGDFDEPESRTLIPLLELTCCYYALGNIDKAVECHKEVEKLFPSHPSVAYNRDFFKSLSLI